MSLSQFNRLLTVSSEAKAWCRLLRDVKELPLNSEMGTLKVASSLFPDGRDDYTKWRQEEVKVSLTGQR